MVVLDTSFLIALQHDDPNALQALEDLRAHAEPLRVPAACWIEYVIAFPVVKQGTAARLLDASVIFEPFERRRADVAVRLQTDLGKAGRPLGWRDLQVAATAIECNEPLVSNDQAFRDVPGLDIYPH